MPQPRKAIVSVDTTPSYHVVSRYVRRTFLFGVVDNKKWVSYVVTTPQSSAIRRYHTSYR